MKDFDDLAKPSHRATLAAHWMSKRRTAAQNVLPKLVSFRDFWG
jgi:hypothetical protein